MCKFGMRFFLCGKNSFQVISNAVFIGYETLIATLNSRQSASTALAVVGFMLEVCKMKMDAPPDLLDINIHTWNPNDLYFCWKRPGFGGLTFKNRGHWGSRYIIYLSWHLYISCIRRYVSCIIACT